MKIIIGADLVPTKSNYSYFSNGNIESIIDDGIIDIINSANYRIFNLEVPLTDTVNNISKAGPHLIAPTSTINGIKKLNIDFFTLANNHILDQNVEGLESTMNVLNNNHIAFAGVGNIDEAAKCYFIELEGKKIGIFCCTEHEFSIVESDRVGANPFIALDTPDLILEYKKQCDYLIILYHGGKEQYRYPSPNLQKICHKLVDKGADLIVCQHSHCIGCEEKYKHGTIVYGQGNFLFDRFSNEFWNESLLLELKIDDDNVNINYIPIVKNGNGVVLADKISKERILTQFIKRSEEIKTYKFIENEYEKYALKNLDNYILSLCMVNNGFVFKVFNKLSFRKFQKIIVKRYIKKKRNTLINKIECEAHSELLLTALKNIEK